MVTAAVIVPGSSALTRKDAALCEKLKRLGFTRGQEVMLYGYKFELLTDPFVIAEGLVVVDALEKRSSSVRRVCIPLPILKRVIEC